MRPGNRRKSKQNMLADLKMFTPWLFYLWLHWLLTANLCSLFICVWPVSLCFTLLLLGLGHKERYKAEAQLKQKRHLAEERLHSELKKKVRFHTPFYTQSVCGHSIVAGTWSLVEVYSGVLGHPPWSRSIWLSSLWFFNTVCASVDGISAVF